MDFEMEIYLLRHAESVANEQMLVCGSADYPLSKRGVVQAAKVRMSLQKIRFSQIYVSPLSRAVDTISGLNSGVTVCVEEQLKELNVGFVSHITLPELWAADWRFRRPWRTPNLRYPGGETFKEMVDRISSWFEAKFKLWGCEDKILIVGHEGTLRVIYSALMELLIDNYPEFVIGNCDYLYFEVRGRRVLRFRHVPLGCGLNHVQ